jgi:serine/threonine protein kinase
MINFDAPEDQCYLRREIIQGKKHSFASDIWSLGILVNELMTFKKVAEQEKQLELRKGSEFEELRLSNYSYDLQNIIKLMLVKDPFTRISLKIIRNYPTLWNFGFDDTQYTDEIENLKKENTKQQDIIQQLEEEVQSLQSENKKLKAENQKLEDQNELPQKSKFSTEEN